MGARLHRNIVLGAALIFAASVVLLLSDVGQRTRDSGAGATAKRWKVYLIQYNNVEDVQESEEGVLEGLHGSGLVEGSDYEVKVVNAQGDMATVSALVDTPDRSERRYHRRWPATTRCCPG